MSKILIIEDDTNINNLLCESLTQNGYTCRQAFSGTESSYIFPDFKPDLVLLDLMLPGINGEDVLSYIRKAADTPIIVISAKDNLDSVVDVLSCGADDYIRKPFELKEVLARISVQLRRHAPAGGDNSIEYKNIVLDKSSFSVKVNGTVIDKITRQEFSILELLIKNPKRVFTKEEIFEYAWNEPYIGETKTLDVHISNIRKKIKFSADTDIIETVWGIGYKLGQ